MRCIIRLFKGQGELSDFSLSKQLCLFSRKPESTNTLLACFLPPPLPPSPTAWQIAVMPGHHQQLLGKLRCFSSVTRRAQISSELWWVSGGHWSWICLEHEMQMYWVDRRTTEAISSLVSVFNLPWVSAGGWTCLLQHQRPLSLCSSGIGATSRINTVFLQCLYLSNT